MCDVSFRSRVWSRMILRMKLYGPPWSGVLLTLTPVFTRIQTLPVPSTLVNTTNRLTDPLNPLPDLAPLTTLTLWLFSSQTLSTGRPHSLLKYVHTSYYSLLTHGIMVFLISVPEFYFWHSSNVPALGRKNGPIRCLEIITWLLWTIRENVSRKILDMPCPEVQGKFYWFSR